MCSLNAGVKFVSDLTEDCLVTSIIVRSLKLFERQELFQITTDYRILEDRILRGDITKYCFDSLYVTPNLC